MNLSEKGIIIRETIEADLPQIYSYVICNPLMMELPFPPGAENLAEIFASKNSICYTAVRKKKVLGFIIGSEKDNQSRIHWMMVRDKLRKSGIGSELLKQFIDNSGTQNGDKYLVAISGNSPESVKFFTGKGFNVKENFVELHRKI